MVKHFLFVIQSGKSTAEEGYKEADIIVDGKTEQALGGGNCQVSTTLYNAVLASSGLTVTEHHDHGKKVPYIEQGKDATVAYNSLDLKFKNNTDSDLKLLVEVTNNKVIAKILKIEY